MSAVRPTAIQLADVIKLPVPERLKLVEAIWDSIAAVPDAIELSEAQRAELQHRLDDCRSNPSVGSPLGRSESAHS
jgi:putative addiction module component (TIGR02574 family)